MGVVSPYTRRAPFTQGVKGLHWKWLVEKSPSTIESFQTMEEMNEYFRNIEKRYIERYDSLLVPCCKKAGVPIRTSYGIEKPTPFYQDKDGEMPTQEFLQKMNMAERMADEIALHDVVCPS